MPRNCRHRRGPPRSRASRATPAVSPPPALSPPTAIRSGSTPSSAGVLRDPDQGGVAVLEPGRERVLRRQAVVDGEHHRADLGGDPPAVGVVEVEAADDEAAAVDVDERGQGAVVVGGLVAAHPDLGSALRSGDQQLVDVQGDGRVVRRQRGQQLRLTGAGGRDVGEGQLGEGRGPGCELGVVGVGHRHQPL